MAGLHDISVELRENIHHELIYECVVELVRSVIEYVEVNVVDEVFDRARAGFGGNAWASSVQLLATSIRNLL